MSDNLPLSAITDTAAEKVSFLQPANSSATKQNGASDQSFSSALRDAHENRQLLEDSGAEFHKTELALAVNTENSQLLPQYGNELPNWGNINLAVSSSTTVNDLNSTEIVNADLSSTHTETNFVVDSLSHSTLNMVLQAEGTADDAIADDPQTINTTVLNTTAVNAVRSPGGVDTSGTGFSVVTNQAISPVYPNSATAASYLHSEAHLSHAVPADNIDDLLNAASVIPAITSNEKPFLVPTGMTPVHMPLPMFGLRYEPIRSESSILPARVLDHQISSINMLAQNSGLNESPSSTIGSQYASGATLWNNLMGQVIAQGQNSEINKLGGVESAAVPTVDALLEETPLVATSSSTRIEDSGLPKSFFQLTGKLQSPQWGQELAQKVQVLVQNNLQQVQLQVNPKHLGPVEISIVMSSDQQVSVTFHVQNAQVKDAIDAAMPRLKEMLDQQGLNLANTDVSHQSNQKKTSDRGSSLSGDQERGDLLSDEDQSAHQVEGYYLDEPNGRVDLFA